MTALTIHQSTLAEALWPRREAGQWRRNVVLALVGTIVLTLSAKTQIPFWPVPMTMQTFAVLVIAMAFGPRLGTATILLYLAEGAIGLPVFAGTPEKGVGLAYMMGPTGGYLVGFFAASVLLGYFGTLRWDRSFVRTTFAMVLGTIVIFLCGFSWLSVLIGIGKAWEFGVAPFVLGAVLKIALAAVVLPATWKAVRRL
jgi:biotin transport system substrate-specific component